MHSVQTKNGLGRQVITIMVDLVVQEEALLYLQMEVDQGCL